MVTILGAGGAIGGALVPLLAARNEPVRLASRHPKAVEGAAEVMRADLSNFDDALRAVSGSRIAFLLAGLKYDLKVWSEMWPRIMRNTIEAAKRSGTRLVFFDNVYMYGKVEGAMTEETPFRPSSQKGEIRAEIATMLLDEMRAGRLTALIARAADFYGPGARTGLPNVLIFDRFAKETNALWLLDDSVKHSFTYTPDAARSLALLAESETAWNQTWHVPTANDSPTGKQLIEMAAREFGLPPRHRVFKRPMLWLAGRFYPVIRELYEMAYQYESDYVFDSSKFQKAFPFQPTSYAEGVRVCVEAYGE
ncbi:MAG TPA: NAD-dependent epimerase/dehydratase family protein [Bryobacteraceae bacterium]|nr:NAD-dependent epimerase/dehydratase family protein [Bryobacteraceae bacterium]